MLASSPLPETPPRGFSEAVPAPPLLRLLALATAILGVLHLLAITPFTNSMDDIKRVTLALGGGGLLALWGFAALRGQAPRPSLLLGVALIAFPLLCILSTLLSLHDFARWAGWEDTARRGALVGWFLAGFAAVGAPRLLRLGLRAFVFVTLAVAGFGLAHYFGLIGAIQSATGRGWAPAPGEPPPVLRSLLFTYAGEPEMISTILNTQFFANLLSLLLPVCIASLVIDVRRALDNPPAGDRSKHWAIAAGAASLMAVACTVLTLSKSSIFLLPVMAVMLAVLLRGWAKVPLRIPQWPLAAALAAIVAATLLVLAWDDIAGRFRTIDQSVGSREVIWSGAWNMFTDHPVLGAGPGSFVLLFPRYRSPDYHLTDVSNVTLSAHNWALDVMAETGALGLAAYLLLPALAAWLGLRAMAASPSREMRIAVAGIFTGVAMLYASNLATPMLRWPVGAVAGALSLGVLAGAARTALHGAVAADERGRSACGIAGLALAAVLVPVAVLPAFTSFRAAVRHSEGIAWTAVADSSPPGPAANADYLRGIERMESAVDLHPPFLTAYYRLAATENKLANALRAQGDDAGAREHDLAALDAYDRLAAFAPDYSEIAFNRAILLNLLSEQALSEAETAGDGDAAALRARAREHSARAVEDAERALKLSNKVITIFVGAGVHEGAHKAAAEGSPERAAFAARAGELYLRVVDAPFSVFKGDADQLETERNLKGEAERRAPLLFARAGELERAAEIAEAAWRKHPGEQIHLRRAISYWIEAGNAAEVERLFADALETNPLDMELRLLRADIALDRGEHVEPQLDFIDAVAARFPGVMTQSERAALLDLRARTRSSPSNPSSDQTP